MKLAEQITERLPSGFIVTMDEASRATKPRKQPAEDVVPTDGIVGIQALDVGYTSLKQHLRKSQELFGADAPTLQCCVCQSEVPSSGASTLVCSNDDCSAVSHLQCLATKFQSEIELSDDLVVRSTGRCPTCSSELQWVNLAKELSLRMRGEREIKEIFKTKRVRKGTATEAVQDHDADSSGEEDALPDIVPEEYDWPQIDDSSEEEVAPVGRRLTKGVPAPKRTPRKPSKQIRTTCSEPVIEDSEWDEAEILT